MKALGVVMAVVAVLVSQPVNGAAQDDLSGVWDLTVMTEQGDQTLTITVVQDGQDLMATGSTEFGAFEMTGAVDGAEVRLSFELDMQGTPLEIVFTGTLAEGVMAGTADFGGLGGGDWTAKRAEG